MSLSNLLMKAVKIPNSLGDLKEKSRGRKVAVLGKDAGAAFRNLQKINATRIVVVIINKKYVAVY